ncbi:hypothetical protein LTR53_010142 [Teratosphaeriaceae sp. CCFEE 6253]|nr:hypothetical protein LTR53_010142 [Teratosphaeriaceae sp. CCFEE 6253]
MADKHGAAGGLEDQLRRMILNNGQDAARPAQPTVRLPPNASSHQPAQPAFPPSRPTATHPTNSASIVNRQPPPGQALPPSGLGRAKPQGRQNQQQRRMQPQYAMNQPQQPHSQQRMQMDPNAFQRGGQVAGYYQRPQQSPRPLFNPNAYHGPPPGDRAEQHMRQAQYFEHLAVAEIAKVTMSSAERDEKENFRMTLEKIVHDVCNADPTRLPKVSLESFGSFRSGFANAGSDMDLVIVLPNGTPSAAGFGLMEDDLPRALEKQLLQLGIGARLLSRTRVPIIKICERPNESLLDRLRVERYDWDVLDNEKKYPHLHPEVTEVEDEGLGVAAVNARGLSRAEAVTPSPDTSLTLQNGTDATSPMQQPIDDGHSASAITNDTATFTANSPLTPGNAVGATPNDQPAPPPVQSERILPPKRDIRPFTRERKMGPLDFPKDGVGIQSDINFFNPLGLHNTQLLRCYSLCDARVKAMVLFVKSWAKRRKINSSYSGTLSSYGYVLMVLHYLVNVAQPPVLPNLQLPWRPSARATPAGADRVECDGWVVDFWRNEDEILAAVQAGRMSTNNESLGSLLDGFFRYYSSIGGNPQFYWTQEVLSLRSPGGVMSKGEKGWVKAVTEAGEGKKVQHRYLFCIEDPFELSHNVARTVTHYGIVAIRDEFRRARRILVAKGFEQTNNTDGELFDELVEIVAAPIDESLSRMTQGGSAQNGDVHASPMSARPAVTGNGERAAGQHQAQSRAQTQHGQVKSGNARVPQRGPINVTDNDAFPTLGAGKAKPQARKATTKEADAGEMSVISGDRAKAYLEQVKRKKAEADVESTAKGAAEAVLDGE